MGFTGKINRCAEESDGGVHAGGAALQDGDDVISDVDVSRVECRGASVMTHIYILIIFSLFLHIYQSLLRRVTFNSAQ